MLSARGVVLRAGAVAGLAAGLVFLFSVALSALLPSAVRAGVLVRLAAVPLLSVFAPPAFVAPFVAPLPVVPLYGAAALAGTTPAPLNSPGFAVAATSGFPRFTEANWLRLEAADFR